MTAADWATAASLATALGTLVLAVAKRLASSDDHPVWMLTVTRHWNSDRPGPRQGDRPVAP